MSERSADSPWWWLTDSECVALGIGAGVRRTAHGFVFGREGQGPRVEVVAREADGPVKLGPAALRLWGAPLDANGIAVLAAAAKILHARRGRGFDPASAGAVDAPDAARNDAASRSVLIDVPSACDRACVFCGASRTPIAERKVRGDERDVDRAIERISTGDSVLFTGNDAMSAPRLVEWIDRARLRAAAVRVISPWTTDRDVPRADAFARAGLTELSTGIFGSTAARHDAITARGGSFASLLSVGSAFRAQGVAVSLVCPLITPLLDDLPGIVAHAARVTPRPLTFMVFAPDSEQGHAFDALVPAHSALRLALETVADSNASFEAVAECLLPASRRHQRTRVLDRSDPDLRAVQPEAVCSNCRCRETCPGVANTVVQAVGVDGLTPIT